MKKSITLKQLSFTNLYNNTAFCYNGVLVLGSFLKKNIIDWQGQLAPDAFQKCVLNRKVFLATEKQIENKDYR